MVQRKVSATPISKSSSRRDQEPSKAPSSPRNTPTVPQLPSPVDRKAQELALSGRGELQLAPLKGLDQAQLLSNTTATHDGSGAAAQSNADRRQVVGARSWTIEIPRPNSFSLHRGPEIEENKLCSGMQHVICCESIFVALQYPPKLALQFSVFSPTPACANALLALNYQKYL
jgi:hypothetical protein